MRTDESEWLTNRLNKTVIQNSWNLLSEHTSCVTHTYYTQSRLLGNPMQFLGTVVWIDTKKNVMEEVELDLDLKNDTHLYQLADL